ncbi:MAG: hypothetical protein OEZ12_04740 [Candidatus Bathyarchaeota archaeon]|nr:hypothetical protein [Candidatus Bathyarchaeota archaeon]
MLPHQRAIFFNHSLSIFIRGKIPKKRRKRKEIVVAAPAFGRREEALHKDTTGGGSVDVFRASEKVGRLLSGLIVAVGALLSLFSLYGILTSTPFLFSDLWDHT